jgi:hypothetical protein
LSREEQAKYYDLARRERQTHMRLYPGWTARDNYAKQKKKPKKRDPVREGGGGGSGGGGRDGTERHRDQGGGRADRGPHDDDESDVVEEGGGDDEAHVVLCPADDVRGDDDVYGFTKYVFLLLPSCNCCV